MKNSAAKSRGRRGGRHRNRAQYTQRWAIGGEIFARFTFVLRGYDISIKECSPEYHFFKNLLCTELAGAEKVLELEPHGYIYI
jgi:hypothetical protein